MLPTRVGMVSVCEAARVAMMAVIAAVEKCILLIGKLRNLCVV
jgi:hypothetical protein